jgi:hypothetical protein
MMEALKGVAPIVIFSLVVIFGCFSWVVWINRGKNRGRKD